MILWDKLAPIVPDKIFLSVKFRLYMGEKLNLKSPKTFNEKLQWLKIYSKKHPEYTKMVDKVAVKDYVSTIIGDQYIIPTLGVWDKVDDIDWDSLPNQFVVKATGDSGDIVVCRDKSTFNIEEAVAKLKRFEGRVYWRTTREYPYRGVPPRYIAEKYMEDVSCEDIDFHELKDYKIFCFDGEPKFLFVASDRQKENEETKFDFFDLKWNHLPIRNGHPNSDENIQKPEHLDEMIKIAKKLSKGIPHVRVDLYDTGDSVYFGELTFFHWSGLEHFEPIEWDKKFGEMIKLPTGGGINVR